MLEGLVIREKQSHLSEYVILVIAILIHAYNSYERNFTAWLLNRLCSTLPNVSVRKITIPKYDGCRNERVLCWMCDHTRFDKIGFDMIRDKVGVAPYRNESKKSGSDGADIQTGGPYVHR